VTATSPAPDSTTASAVLADIGVELPNRKMTVARANHATRTVMPIAAHSSPAAPVMASSTGPDLDDASARLSAGTGGGAGAATASAAGFASLSLVSMASPAPLASPSLSELRA
jgi:hypothetical protein